MKAHEFTSLYFLGISVEHDGSFDWSRKSPEEIICYNLERALTDGRAASLLLSYFHYYNWLLDADVMYREASKLSNQKEINLLCGMLLKVDANKYKRTINLSKPQAPVYKSKICEIKIVKAGVTPDPEFKKVGFLTQGYEYEKEGKFEPYKIVLKINKVIAERAKKLKPFRTELKNMNANSLEFGVLDRWLNTNEYLKHIGVLVEAGPIADPHFLIEDSLIQISKLMTKSHETLSLMKAWFSKFSFIVRTDLLLKKMNDKNLSVASKAILAALMCEYCEPNKALNEFKLSADESREYSLSPEGGDYIDPVFKRFGFKAPLDKAPQDSKLLSLKELAAMSPIVRNRIIAGPTNKADVVSLLMLDPEINPYRIAKVLMINYETAHRNYQLSLLAKDI